MLFVSGQNNRQPAHRFGCDQTESIIAFPLHCHALSQACVCVRSLFESDGIKGGENHQCCLSFCSLTFITIILQVIHSISMETYSTLCKPVNGLVLASGLPEGCFCIHMSVGMQHPQSSAMQMKGRAAVDLFETNKAPLHKDTMTDWHDHSHTDPLRHQTAFCIAVARVQSKKLEAQ